MTSTDPHPSAPASPDLLGRWFWVETPVRLARRAPTLASALSDGQYLLRWRPVSWLVVLFSAVAGVALEIAQDDEVFTTSLLVVIGLCAMGTVSVQLGCYGLLGYLATDLATGRQVGRRGLFATQEWWYPLGKLVSMLTEYLVLAGGVVAVPMLILALRMEMRRRGLQELIGSAGERFVQAMAVVVLYYVWCQSTVSSIRNVYRPVEANIPTTAVFNMQERWHYIAAAMVLVTVLRWALERAAFRPESLAVLRETTARFSAVAPDRSGSLGRRIVFQLVVGLVLLGGVIDDLWQIPVTAGIIVAVALARHRLARSRPGAAIGRIPLLARLGGVVVVSYLVFSTVSDARRGSFLDRDDFVAMWAAVLLMYTVTGLLTFRHDRDSPDGTGDDESGSSSVPPAEPSPGRTGLARRGSAVLGLLPLSGLLVLVTADPAIADNCSGLNDCWGTTESFLLAMGVVLVVLGVALILSPTITLAAPALLTAEGMAIGASVTIPASALTTAGVGATAVSAGLVVGTQADDLITLATAEGAGRGDAHGDAGRELDKIEERIREAQERLAELERNQGPKKQKDRLRRLIRNLRQAAERARKGETHGRRGRGQQN